MAMEKRKELIEKLHNALELERKTVGIRFLDTEEDFQNSTAQELLHKLPYCVMIKAGTKGHPIKIKPDNMGCFAAARALGMTEVTESYLSGEDYMGFDIFDNQEASKKVVDGISIIDREVYGVEISPLEKMDQDPDVVIQVSTPYNIMRLIQGYNYYYGTYSNYRMGGLQAICSESTAYPYMSDDINVSMMCAGTRYMAQWKREELALSMPYSKFEATINGLLKTIDPLERDGDKERIEKNYKDKNLEDLNLHYGQNYDTDYYEIGEKGLR